MSNDTTETGLVERVSCDRREALIRSRENLAYVHQAVLAKGISESELVL